MDKRSPSASPHYNCMHDVVPCAHSISLRWWLCFRAHTTHTKLRSGSRPCFFDVRHPWLNSLSAGRGETAATASSPVCRTAAVVQRSGPSNRVNKQSHDALRGWNLQCHWIMRWGHLGLCPDPTDRACSQAPVCRRHILHVAGTCACEPHS